MRGLVLAFVGSMAAATLSSCSYAYPDRPDFETEASDACLSAAWDYDARTPSVDTVSVQRPGVAEVKGTWEATPSDGATFGFDDWAARRQRSWTCQFSNGQASITAEGAAGEVAGEVETPLAFTPAPEPAPVWVCAYSPTYDEDWHNDVECSDGVNTDRPYLREWDDFVTEDEIMQSAREYEDALNAGAVSRP